MHYPKLLLLILVIASSTSLFGQRYTTTQEIVTREETRDTIITDNIYYSSAQYGLLVPQIKVLDKVAALARRAHDYEINLYGYADHLGTTSFNDSLSNRRVWTAKHYLSYRKLDPGKIIPHPLGEIEPEAGQNTIHDNRRVTIEATLMFREIFQDTLITRTFIPCPERDSTFLTDYGAIVYVPGCAYEESGYRIRDLEYTLSESFTRSDMVLNGLPTIASNNECLQTSGMISFYTTNPKEDYVLTDEGKEITVMIPTDAFEEKINLFIANTSRGSVNSWEPTNEQPNWVIDSLTQQKYYVFTTRGNFNINLDIPTGIFSDQQLSENDSMPHFKLRRFKQEETETYLSGNRSNLEGLFFHKRKFFFDPCECIPENERTVTLIAQKKDKTFVYHRPIKEVKQQKWWLFGKGPRYVIRRKDFEKVSHRDRLRDMIADN
jgi:hypothetical protein